MNDPKGDTPNTAAPPAGAGEQGQGQEEGGKTPGKPQTPLFGRRKFLIVIYGIIAELLVLIIVAVYLLIATCSSTTPVKKSTQKKGQATVTKQAPNTGAKPAVPPGGKSVGTKTTKPKSDMTVKPAEAATGTKPDAGNPLLPLATTIAIIIGAMVVGFVTGNVVQFIQAFRKADQPPPGQ